MLAVILNSCASIQCWDFDPNTEYIIKRDYVQCGPLIKIAPKPSTDEKIMGIKAKTFLNQIEIKSISIDGDVGEIEKDSFKGCSNLIQFKCSGTIDRISDSAFAGTSLRDLHLSVKILSSNSLNGITSLQNLVVSNVELFEKSMISKFGTLNITGPKNSNGIIKTGSICPTPENTFLKNLVLEKHSIEIDSYFNNLILENVSYDKDSFIRTNSSKGAQQKFQNNIIINRKKLSIKALGNPNEGVVDVNKKPNGVVTEKVKNDIIEFNEPNEMPKIDEQYVIDLKEFAFFSLIPLAGAVLFLFGLRCCIKKASGQTKSELSNDAQKNDESDFMF